MQVVVCKQRCAVEMARVLLSLELVYILSDGMCVYCTKITPGQRICGAYVEDMWLPKSNVRDSTILLV